MVKQTSPVSFLRLGSRILRIFGQRKTAKNVTTEFRESWQAGWVTCLSRLARVWSVVSRVSRLSALRKADGTRRVALVLGMADDSAPSRRLQNVLAHLQPQACNASIAQERVPSRDVRQDGWGYADTAFVLNEKKHIVELSGTRCARNKCASAIFPRRRAVYWFGTSASQFGSA